MTLSDYFTKAAGFGNAGPENIWRNHDPLNTSWFSVWVAAAVGSRIINQAGSVLHDTGLINKNTQKITGALLGTAVFVVMTDGELFVSEDGATFVQRATGYGFTQDSILQGGGALVSAVNGASTSALINISLDRGVTFANKSGNLNSVLSGSLVVVNHGLIYG